MDRQKAKSLVRHDDATTTGTDGLNRRGGMRAGGLFCLASPRLPCIVSQEADYYNSRSQRMWIRAVYDICISHNITICYDGDDDDDEYDDDEDDEPFMKCLYPTPDLPFH